MTLIVASFSLSFSIVCAIVAKDIGNILNNAHIHNWGKEGPTYISRVLTKLP